MKPFPITSRKILPFPFRVGNKNRTRTFLNSFFLSSLSRGMLQLLNERIALSDLADKIFVLQLCNRFVSSEFRDLSTRKRYPLFQQFRSGLFLQHFPGRLTRLTIFAHQKRPDKVFKIIGLFCTISQ